MVTKLCVARTTSPESSEPFPERVAEGVTKTKSLDDLWCLTMVDKSSHTSHGGISSEEQRGKDREEVGSSQAADCAAAAGRPGDPLRADDVGGCAGAQFGGGEV